MIRTNPKFSQVISLLLFLAVTKAAAQENPVVAADSYYEAANITETQSRLMSIFNSAMGGTSSSSGATGEQGSYSVNQVTGSFCYDKFQGSHRGLRLTCGSITTASMRMIF